MDGREISKNYSGKIIGFNLKYQACCGVIDVDFLYRDAKGHEHTTRAFSNDNDRGTHWKGWVKVPNHATDKLDKIEGFYQNGEGIVDARMEGDFYHHR